jgi:hypothetical protein
MAANGKTTWHFTVRRPNGEPLMALLVECEPANGESRPPAATTEKSAPARPQAATNGTANDEAKMTDPQKRYLFRLLGAQGVQGKDAEAQLKQYFRVMNLRDVTKAAASEYINQLAKDRKDAHGT